MARKSKPRVKNSKKNEIKNGFGGALGFDQSNPGFLGQYNGGAGGQFPGGFSGEQIEDSTTMFKNLRWYMVSNFRQLLSQLYVEIGLIQTIVKTPVDDGFRGGVLLKSKQLDEEQIKELILSIDRDANIETIKQALGWNRLFGGAGILIVVGDQDPMEPLDLKSITADTEVEFRAVDMWELFWDKQNAEGYDAELQTEEFEFYSYYSENVHKSRVMALKGMEAPSFVRPRLRGWGMSVVESLVRSINQYLKATDLTFEVLDEFKVDVYKIKNLVNTLLTPQGTNTVKQRIQMANWQKNYQNAVVMDSEDDWDHKQLSFAGLGEAMASIRQQVAADMRIPQIKLFGQSFSGGLGNSAQEEMENYNSMVEGEVREKGKYQVLRVAEIKCQKLFGFIPDDLECEFKPLREVGAVDQETVKTQKFTRLAQAIQMGAITAEEFRDSCNKGNLFDVQLDKGVTLDLNIGGDEDSSEDPDKKDDTPGADRPDTKKVKTPTKDKK